MEILRAGWRVYGGPWLAWLFHHHLKPRPPTPDFIPFNNTPYGTVYFEYVVKGMVKSRGQCSMHFSLDSDFRALSALLTINGEGIREHRHDAMKCPR